MPGVAGDDRSATDAAQVERFKTNKRRTAGNLKMKIISAISTRPSRFIITRWNFAFFAPEPAVLLAASRQSYRLFEIAPAADVFYNNGNRLDRICV